MAKSGRDSPEFKKFFRNVKKFIDPKTVSKAIIASPAGAELINVVIGQARAGVGPSQDQYERYSKDYGKRKSAAGQKGVPFWLRGIGNTGRSGGMLDPLNFGYEIVGGRFFFVWRPKVDPKQGDYAAVHNDGNDTTPRRRWMHLRSPAPAKAVLKLFTTVYKTLITKILAGGNL